MSARGGPSASLAASEGLAVVPAVLLIMLFQGSTWMTERITAQKYKEYRDYQARVNRFVPSIFPAY